MHFPTLELSGGFSFNLAGFLRGAASEERGEAERTRQGPALLGLWLQEGLGGFEGIMVGCLKPETCCPKIEQPSASKEFEPPAPAKAKKRKGQDAGESAQESTLHPVVSTLWFSRMGHLCVV